MNTEDELLARLREADAVIGYSRMADEPDIHAFLKEMGIANRGRSILADKHVSPHDFATALSTAHAGEKVCILIPGRAFDISGTRHGRGGGWYDRFLKEVPRKWVRIGVLHSTQLSEEKLKREAWDEPVDYLLIQDDAVWKILRTDSKT